MAQKIIGDLHTSQVESGKVVITRKIEIGILHAGDDKEALKAKYDFLFSLRKDVFRAANLVVNHQFYNLLFTNRLKDELTVINGNDTIQDKQGNTLSLTQAKLVAEKIYNTSTQNSTYQIIGEHFPEMPSCIKSALNSVVFSSFKADIKGVLRGDKSVRNYRYGMPIPFNVGSGMKFIAGGEDKDQYSLTWTKDIAFYLRFGKDRSGNRIIVDRIISGDYKFCDSSVSYDQKRNKWFLLLCVKMEKQVLALDHDQYVATNLGMNCPIFLTSSLGHKMQIGDKQDFLHKRLQFQSRYRSIQQSCKGAKSGHGRTRKMKALDRLKAAEKGFSQTYNHTLSKQVVQFCVRNGIGTIKTEDLLGSANTMNQSFVLRNWGYFQLQAMIEYKAAFYGIKVVKLPTRNITKTCNCCGTVSDEAVDIKQRVYKCTNSVCPQFQIAVDIDENASLNNLKAVPEEKK